MSRLGFAKATTVATLSFLAVAGTATTADAQQGSRFNITTAARVQDPDPDLGEGETLVIDFLRNFATAGTVGGTVRAAEEISGVFEGNIVAEQQGEISDIVINSSGVIGTPIANFMTLGGYTFSLTGTSDGNAFGPISLIPGPDGTTARFGVRGFVTGGSFGMRQVAYRGFFNAGFIGQTPEEVFEQIDGGTSRRVSVQANFEVVPEPSTYMLLATGLGALGMVARRRNRA